MWVPGGEQAPHAGGGRARSGRGRDEHHRGLGWDVRVREQGAVGQRAVEVIERGGEVVDHPDRVGQRHDARTRIGDAQQVPQISGGDHHMTEGVTGQGAQPGGDGQQHRAGDIGGPVCAAAHRPTHEVRSPGLPRDGPVEGGARVGGLGGIGHVDEGERGRAGQIDRHARPARGDAERDRQTQAGSSTRCGAGTVDTSQQRSRQPAGVGHSAGAAPGVGAVPFVPSVGARSRGRPWRW